MTQIDSFSISNGLSVRCFINDADALHVLENKLKADPAHLELNVLMGNYYQKIKVFDKAEKYYQKALDANPKFIPALRNLAIHQLMKGHDLDAVNFLKKLLLLIRTRLTATIILPVSMPGKNRVDNSIDGLRRRWIRVLIIGNFCNPTLTS